eukprot:1281301-Amorphochlora_amoeboformis.AAC.1
MSQEREKYEAEGKYEGISNHRRMDSRVGAAFDCGDASHGLDEVDEVDEVGGVDGVDEADEVDE